MHVASFVNFRFCSDELPRAIMVSDTNQVLVHFKSGTESWITKKTGFKIAFKLGEFKNS